MLQNTWYNHSCEGLKGLNKTALRELTPGGGKKADGAKDEIKYLAFVLLRSRLIEHPPPNSPSSRKIIFFFLFKEVQDRTKNAEIEGKGKL